MNDYSRTPLYYAAKHGYRNAADVLIASGANETEITETNYGKAPQLTENLKEGEAYFWYLGGLYGGGYAVKTKEHLIIFDETKFDESIESGLANGHLNPNELAGQKITILITKTYGLKNDPNPFGLSKQVRDIEWVLDEKPVVSDKGNNDIPSYHLAVLHESFSVNGIKINSIPAMGRGHGGAVGVGYLVESEGVKIFHSGFHASSNGSPEKEKYSKEIDYLKQFGPIDVAILTVDGHLTAANEPYLYLLDQLSPKGVYLMGGDYVTNQYPGCVKVLEACDIPVKYPEGGKAMGERFHYVGDENKK